MDIEKVSFYENDIKFIEKEEKEYIKDLFNELVNPNNKNVVIGIEEKELIEFFEKCNNNVTFEQHDINGFDLSLKDINDKDYLVVFMGHKETKLDYIYDVIKRLAEKYGDKCLFTFTINDKLQTGCRVIISCSLKDIKENLKWQEVKLLI